MGVVAYYSIEYYVGVLDCKSCGYMLQVLVIPLWGSLRAIISNILLGFILNLSSSC
jgi:hypothetical protein